MIKITKPLLQKALIAGFFSAFTIGVLTVLTYKSTLGYFIAASFASDPELQKKAEFILEILHNLFARFSW